jgi:hypothetical protein
VYDIDSSSRWLFKCNAKCFELEGAGAGIGGYSDQFASAFEQKIGDFDIQVKIKI